MHRYLALIVFLATMDCAHAGAVSVFIAARSHSLPASGKIAFDIYWINESDRAATIPALDYHSFTYSPLASERSWGATVGHVVDHRGPDRQIAPRRILHDQVTVDIKAEGARLLRVSAEFEGHRSTFKSNTIVLTSMHK
jgi:hypothetical protein